MGNANTTASGSSTGSGHRERNKSGDSDSAHVHPPSPAGVELKDGQAFTFDKKVIRAQTPPKTHPHQKIIIQASHEMEDEPLIYTTKNTSHRHSEGDADGSHYGTDEVHEDLDDDLHLGRGRSSTISEGTSSLLGSKGQGKILPTVFKWDGGGKQVFISGTFSDWKTIPMVKRFGLYSHGDFVTILDLPEGEHQYKFLIDGEWKHDPNEPTTDNDQGTKNNIIIVKKTDFEVFDALDVDSTNSSNPSETNSGSNTKPDYAQDIPSYKPWEKTSGPPILPPHLLQVILNKDTPLSCEPTLLPEPNHVMLNHLYALSIKDGVMVLSATHRYRKKYVTTLLYKPI